MKLFNKTKNIYLSQDIKKADTISDKLFGMIKKSNQSGLFIETRFGIHTFFMKSCIDVIILDNHNKVVKLALVLPNNLFFWNPKYSQVIELSTGIIKKTKIEVDDILSLRTK